MEAHPTGLVRGCRPYKRAARGSRATLESGGIGQEVILVMRSGDGVWLKARRPLLLSS